jgi:hypothetical protein
MAGSTSTSFGSNVIAGANEQEEYIRIGRFDLLDSEHIADAIEGVGARANGENWRTG